MVNYCAYNCMDNSYLKVVVNFNYAFLVRFTCVDFLATLLYLFESFS